MQSDNNANDDNHILLPLVDKNEENVVFPLVLNVLTKFWGEDVPYSEIQKRSVNYNNFKGTVFIEGLELLDKLNLSYISYKSSISDLKKKIKQGFPMIVVLPGIGDIIQFATIVCGYDDKEDRIITYIPEPDSYGAIPVNKFIDEWSQDDYFSILVFPKDMYNIFKNESFEFSNSNKLYLETERLNLQGKIQESIDLLRSIIDKSLSNGNKDNAKSNPQILYLLAGILNEKNDEECISLYERVIKLNPKFYLAYRGLGNYYLKNKNYLLSKENYTKAIEINPQRYGSIYKNLGIVLLELGDNAGARAYFKTYLRFIPNAKDKDNILQFLNS
ncbi:MAG TPA: tetratricopeptide repeat protein [Verrucomicrobiae bacterium]|nr:tetratricopeptide repeat protein [Verrucomicrobiae bacterium]